ncbi:MAG: folate-binding protein [Candidatus Contendobacter sp.]|nr:folate-binding protein [Candidatus Contendobacter sp.]MDG4555857.1 folate-binding protein [Candidatus Contendobacter sp.]
MNVAWNDFLTRFGACLEGGRVAHFGRPDVERWAALRGDICSDLSCRGLIGAQGPDADSFLQGQLTCDVREVTPNRSRIGAYCTPKGRALACPRLFRREEVLYLALPRALVEPTLTRLRRYVLRAKARLEDASDDWTRIGVAGPNAALLLTQQLGVVPQVANSVVRAPADSRDITVIRLPGSTPRFELHGPLAAMQALWTRIDADVTFTGPEPWRLLDILAGTPAVYPETVEAFVPQMLNLQLLDGIGFQKGCYTGQEIVARTHYLGKLKRRMVLARVDSPTPPHPGDPLFSPQTDASQSAGQLADACPHPDGGYAVLAVALIECAERGTLCLNDIGGPALRLEPLPYGFDPAG